VRAPQPDSSASANPPSEPQVDTGPRGPRGPQGGGTSSPGGGGAPNSLILVLALTLVTVGWIRFVTGVSVHLQCPETLFPERPG
jgi:hypothetical protein